MNGEVINLADFEGGPLEAPVISMHDTEPRALVFLMYSEEGIETKIFVEGDKRMGFVGLTEKQSASLVDALVGLRQDYGDALTLRFVFRLDGPEAMFQGEDPGDPFSRLEGYDA